MSPARSAPARRPGGRTLALVALAAAAAGAGAGVAVTGRASPGGIARETAADYLHAVIEADRATYATHVVNRLQNEDKVIAASEHFVDDHALPLPAQMLRMAAQQVAAQGAFRYALISDAAINKANLPKNDFEREGIAAVRAHPEVPYRREMAAGGKRYFLSLYADRAVTNACAKCHNLHPQSPRHDWKTGDVFGAVVVTLPAD